MGILSSLIYHNSLSKAVLPAHYRQWSDCLTMKVFFRWVALLSLYRDVVSGEVGSEILCSRLVFVYIQTDFITGNLEFLVSKFNYFTCLIIGRGAVNIF